MDRITRWTKLYNAKLAELKTQGFSDRAARMGAGDHANLNCQDWCMFCGCEIIPEQYHWYDKLQPEHCIFCAPDTCYNCSVRRSL